VAASVPERAARARAGCRRGSSKESQGSAGVGQARCAPSRRCVLFRADKPPQPVPTPLPVQLHGANEVAASRMMGVGLSMLHAFAPL